MSRIYPVVLLLGLVLMVVGATTTYVALGQDGESEPIEEPATEEIQPTPTLEPTVEAPPVVVEQPAQPMVEAPPVQPTVVMPSPTLVPTEVIPPTLMPTEVIAPTLVPTEVILPTVAPTDVPEQTEAVAPTEVIPPTIVENAIPAVEAAAPEQTEVVMPTAVENVAPTEAVNMPEQTEVVAPTEMVILPEQTEVVAPTEVIDLPVTSTVLDVSAGQSNSPEVPTVGPANPLESTPSVAPTSEVIVPTAESTLEPTVDLLPSATPGDGIATAIPVEATEEAVTASTLIRGSASSAFGQLQGIALTLTQPDGTVLETVTDEQGSFIFEGLLPGDYTLSAALLGALTSQTSFTLTEGQQLELPPAVLPIGDLNQDNQIDMNDVVLVAANYDNPADVIGVDLNGDAWIDISDLAIIGAQFGTVGPLPWS
jgi:hypothetical protein